MQRNNTISYPSCPYETKITAHPSLQGHLLSPTHLTTTTCLPITEYNKLNWRLVIPSRRLIQRRQRRNTLMDNLQMRIIQQCLQIGTGEAIRSTR